MNNSLIQWLRHNLFSTWYHSIFTIITIYLLIRCAIPSLNWLIFNANFLGSGPEACTSGGACWVFVRMRFNQFMYGFYPRDLEWRINLSYIIAAANIIAIIYAPHGYKKWCTAFLCFVFPCIAFILYYGGIFGLEQVDTYSWGGLHLTLVLAFASILLSLPIGIILALCHRSKMPVIRAISVLFIELWRGVPLVSVLFMASYVIPLFFTSDIHFDKILRALVGITLFYSAYMAEEMVSGLRAVKHGQFEAANALAFKSFGRMRLIILPQALRHALPGIVDIFISLFKDTTLIVIIGLFDFFGMIQAANQDPKWLAYSLEGFVFAAFGYWLFCYLMSRYSVHLQATLNVGHKK